MEINPIAIDAEADKILQEKIKFTPSACTQDSIANKEIQIAEFNYADIFR